MDFKTVCMFLPFLGVVWGYSLGVYVKSNKKTPRKRLALCVTGMIITFICIAILIIAFN